MVVVATHTDLLLLLWHEPQMFAVEIAVAAFLCRAVFLLLFALVVFAFVSDCCPVLFLAAVTKYRS